MNHAAPTNAPGPRGAGRAWPPARFVWLLGLAFVLSWLAGCASSSRGGGSSWVGGSGADGIEELHVLGVPMAVKTGRSGVPDAVAVRVFASSRQRAKGLTIGSGTLAILLFDGAFADAELRTIKPVRVWDFPAAALGPQKAVSALGVGYQFVLGWEGMLLRQSRVTVQARFTPPKGSPIYSAPNVISVTGP